MDLMTGLRLCTLQTKSIVMPVCKTLMEIICFTACKIAIISIEMTLVISMCRLTMLFFPVELYLKD